MVIMNKEGSTEIVNFKIPKAEDYELGPGRASHIVKMHYFFKISSSLLWAMVQKNKLYSYYEQGRVYQNCKFHDPWGRGSCDRACPCKSESFLQEISGESINIR